MKSLVLLKEFQETMQMSDSLLVALLTSRCLPVVVQGKDLFIDSSLIDEADILKTAAAVRSTPAAGDRCAIEEIGVLLSEELERVLERAVAQISETPKQKTKNHGKA